MAGTDRDAAPPGQRRVFISHSSHDPFAHEVRNAVCLQLREKNYQVLVDKDELRPGQDWRSVLTHWLADCHAAVLLLTRDALQSTWVRREITILMWRRALGSPVAVIPVLVGDLQPSDVAAAGFSELRQLQFARLVPTGFGDPEALADDITQRLARLPPRQAETTQMRRWADRVSFFLTLVGDQDKLGECARELGVAEEDVRLVKLHEGSRFLAHQLLDEGMSRHAYRAVRVICDFMGREWLDKLIRDVAFTWVSGEAARHLVSASHLAVQQDSVVVTALNAHKQETADDYLNRATCRGEHWRQVAATPVGEDVVEELVCHYEKTIMDLLGIEPPWTLADAAPMDEPAYLIVDPAGVPLESVISALRIVRERHRGIVVLLLTGQDTPAVDDSNGWGLGPVQVLSPPLQPGDELAARRNVRALMQLRNR
ncbi:toll/interleukin-1 receptor domain-containing protein [Virgisporangium aurantiacum]|uniref:TIR domain-containing protein n=1 Tax=Virgisporangium aurantiacum TaxID=175570 RepID=A0A8J3ZJ90_9ACTN|nr:toll/interleukin-1 receptor domain-containing protein [Virgisporangium aurantiacum]GIJ63952.1 hypothetical protein Vau01_114680 [Virgisporangium aurantiacum]